MITIKKKTWIKANWFCGHEQFLAKSFCDPITNGSHRKHQQNLNHKILLSNSRSYVSQMSTSLVSQFNLTPFLRVVSQDLKCCETIKADSNIHTATDVSNSCYYQGNTDWTSCVGYTAGCQNGYYLLFKNYGINICKELTCVTVKPCKMFSNILNLMFRQ